MNVVEQKQYYEPYVRGRLLTNGQLFLTTVTFDCIVGEKMAEISLDDDDDDVIASTTESAALPSSSKLFSFFYPFEIIHL